ncbi:MAG: DUF6754 domain-containing protein [Phycisphaerae bacterium]
MKAPRGPASPARRTLAALLTAALGVALLAGPTSAQDRPPAEAFPATAAAASTSTAPSTASASAPASRPELAADELPNPDSVKAFDRPSDDGSAILVTWSKPAKEAAGLVYVVEMAASPDDFARGQYEARVVEPGRRSLAAAEPGYFGFSEANKRIYFADISPAALLNKPPLKPAQLEEYAAQKVITPNDLARAMPVLYDLGYLAQEPPPAPLPEPWHRPATSAPATQSQPAPAGSQPATASAPASTEEAVKTPTPEDERTWFDHLCEYLSDRKWLIDYARKDPSVLGGKDLARALAALEVGFRQPDAQDAQEEIKWLSRLMEYLRNRELLTAAAAPDRKVISRETLASALAALETEYLKQASPREQAGQGWLHRLLTFVKSQDEYWQADRKAQIDRRKWYFRLAVLYGGRKTYIERDGVPVVVSASAKANWFKWGKLNNLILSLAFCGAVFAFIQVAKRRPNLFIRKIAGLDAVDEAIGRATEMDRPVFFVHGLAGVGDLPTIASINVLARVARRAAEHDTRLRVLNNDPLVTAVSQEVVQQAYTEAGRPDAYNADDVSLVASDQFSYVAAVSGNMVRDQPGAIFLLGYFYAESLLLSETGASTGAIQVAGTDAYTQLPFFITTCDYTLIGEELYAASAYLSREPRLLGSLRGQDIGKAFLMIAIVLLSLVLTIALVFGERLEWVRSLFTAVGG